MRLEGRRERDISSVGELDTHLIVVEKTGRWEVYI